MPSLSYCVLAVIYQCKFYKNGIFNAFFPFLIHAILKLAPVLSQKLEKMHLVRHFCSSIAKTSAVTPICYFMILTIQCFRSMRKKWHNLCSVFWPEFYFNVLFIHLRTRKMPLNALLFALCSIVDLIWTRAIWSITAQSVQFSKIAIPHASSKKPLLLSSFGLHTVFAKGF